MPRPVWIAMASMILCLRTVSPDFIRATRGDCSPVLGLMVRVAEPSAAENPRPLLGSLLFFDMVRNWCLKGDSDIYVVILRL